MGKRCICGAPDGHIAGTLLSGKELIICNSCRGELRVGVKRNLTVLEKLHEIEKEKVIYDIHYCRAGVGFVFYYPEKDPGGVVGHTGFELRDDSWREALSVDGYYPTIEEAIKVEYEKLATQLKSGCPSSEGPDRQASRLEKCKSYLKVLRRRHNHNCKEENWLYELVEKEQKRDKRRKTARKKS